MAFPNLHHLPLVAILCFLHFIIIKAFPLTSPSLNNSDSAIISNSTIEEILSRSRNRRLNFNDQVTLGIHYMIQENPKERARLVYLQTEPLNQMDINRELDAPTHMSIHFKLRDSKYQHARKDLLRGQWSPTFMYERTPKWLEKAIPIRWPPIIDVDYAMTQLLKHGAEANFNQVAMYWDPTAIVEEIRDSPAWEFSWEDGHSLLVDFEGTVWTPEGGTPREQHSSDDDEDVNVVMRGQGNNITEVT